MEVTALLIVIVLVVMCVLYVLCSPQDTALFTYSIEESRRMAGKCQTHSCMSDLIGTVYEMYVAVGYECACLVSIRLQLMPINTISFKDCDSL